MIEKFRYDESALKQIEYKQGKIVAFAGFGLNEQSCISAFEMMRPDFPMKESWTFWHDEFHYVIQGKAEITFTNPPLHNKEEKIIVEAGDAYFTPVGTCAIWKIMNSQPFIHLNVIMPRPASLDTFK